MKGIQLDEFLNGLIWVVTLFLVPSAFAAPGAIEEFFDQDVTYLSPEEMSRALGGLG